MNKIRNVTANDAPAIAQIYNTYVIHSTATFETEPIDTATMKKRIAAIFPAFPYLVYEADGQVLGYAHAHLWKERAAYARTWESTVYVRQDALKKGIGSALMKKLIGECRKMHCQALIACITGGNEASVGLHKKLGYYQVSRFDKVGYKLGQTLDVVDLELLL